MTPTELLDSLLSQLGQICGLPLLSVDDDAHASLVFNQSVTIHFQARPHDILLYSCPGSLPEQNSLAIMRRLLRANFLWGDTGGATFSLTPDWDVMLAQTLSVYHLDLTAFQEHFTAFARVSAKWRELIESAGDEAGADEAASMHTVREDELPAFATRI
jgi:hypothetical protein